MSDAPENTTPPTVDPAATPAENPQPESAPPPGDTRRPNSVTILVGVAVALLAAIVALNLAPGRSGNDDVKTLERKKGERDALRRTVNAERSLQGLPPLDSVGGAEDPETVADRLGRDATALAGMLTQYDNLIIERDAMIAEKGAALVQSEQQRQALTNSIGRLQGQLEKALIDSSGSDLARRQLELERARAEDLALKLQQAQIALAAAGDAVDKADYDRLLSQLEEARRSRDFFEDRARKLEEQLAALQTETVQQDLFADDESELLPAAVELFRRLRKLENQPDADVMAAYSKFGNDLGATVLRKLSFPTGVGELTAEDLSVVNELAPNLPNRGLVFAVGYASVTGNVDKNRELSSSRATNAARAINAHKLSGQQVQAAYLGQTRRFSGTVPERNQIVEIWHILPPAPSE